MKIRTDDAELYYELRGTGDRLVVLVGAPMDADAFAPLAEELATDHLVLTTDPRGINRSRADDPDADSTPALRAADLAQLIDHVGAGPAAVFGSSGGAVTTLHLAQAHPESVHTVIPHEPPVIDVLDDRDELRAGTERIIATYVDGDVMAAWRLFLGQAGIEMPDELVEHVVGGEQTEQQLADQRFWFRHELRGSTFWRPDLQTLRESPVRIVIGVGEDSAGQLCDRTSARLATLIEAERASFPGDHTGFTEDVTGFAARLRTVLAGREAPVAI